MRRRPLTEVLHQDTRVALLDVVRRSPGVAFARAAEALGVDYSTIQYHVRVLERHGAIQALHLAGALRLYPPGAAPARHERPVLDALACATARRVLALAAARRAVTLRDLILDLDLPRSTAQENLKRLARAGVLEARPARKGPTVYVARDAGPPPPAPPETL